MPPEELAAIASEIFGPERVHVTATLREGLQLAKDLVRSRPGAQDDGVGPGVGILATGSVVTAGDIRALTGRAPQ